MKRFLLGFAVMVFLLGAQTVRADGFFQGFETWGDGAFTSIAVFSQTPGVFMDTPGLGSGLDGTWATGGWSSTNINPSYALATGVANTLADGNGLGLNYILHVTSSQWNWGNPPPYAGFTWHGYVFNGATLVEAFSATWDGTLLNPDGSLCVGCGWSFTDFTATGAAHYAQENTTPVPEPATLSLFGLGLVYLGKKLRKQKAAA